MSDEVICPRGHRVTRDAVTRDAAGLPLCPVCAADPMPTGWSLPVRRRWSRPLLAVPLAIAALAFGLAVFSDVLAYQAYSAHPSSYPSQFTTGAAIGIATSALTAVALAVAAWLVTRE